MAGEIRVINTIKPKNDADFPIAEDVNLKGAFRTVADAAARNAITANHRKVGMFVVTQDDGKVWQLDSDLTSWTEFTGGGAVPTFYTVTGTAPTPAVDFPVPNVPWAVVNCNTTAGPVVVQLTPKADGTLVDVKDVAGTAANYPISITASEFIDGEELIKIVVARGGVRLMARSGTWQVVSSHRQDTENPLVLNGLNVSLSIPSGYPWVAIVTDTTAGPITITIPTGEDGDVVEVKDGSGTAATNNVSILSTTADIDEHTDNQIEITDNHGGVRLMKIGAKWRIMPRFAAGGGGTLAGDVTGPAGTNTVSALQGVTLNDPSTANDGDLIKLNSVEWVTEDGMAALAFDGTYIWATSWEPRLFKIDPTTRTIVSQHDLSTYAINRPAEWIKTTATRVVLVPFGSRDVSIVRASDGAEVGAIDVASPDGSEGALIVGADDLYLSCRHSFTGVRTIYKFSIAAIEASYPTPVTLGSAVDTLVLTGTDSVAGLAYNGTHIYVSRRTSVWRVDPTTFAEVDSYSFGPGETCNDIIFAFGSFWTPADDSFVYRFDPSTFPAGGSRTAIASTHTAGTWIAADSTHIWVPDWDSNATVYRFSTGVGTEAQTQTIVTETGDEHGYITATTNEIWTAIDWFDGPTLKMMSLRRFSTGATATYEGQFGDYAFFGYGTAAVNLGDLTNPGGALGDLPRWDGTDWVRLPVGSSNQYLGVTAGTPAWKTLSVNVGDNGRADRAVVWKQAGAFGGRDWGTPGGDSSAFSYNASTSLSMTTGTGTVPMLFCTALLGENLFFTGSVGGFVGRLYKINLATKATTLVSGTNFNANGQLTGAATNGGATISADNATDMVAHRNWLNGDSLAVLTPKGLFLLHPTAYNASYPASLFRGKPSTTDGFLGGRIVSVNQNSTNPEYMGLVVATAPNESKVYFADWNNNIGASFPSQAFGTNPTAICADANGKVWIVDRGLATLNVSRCTIDWNTTALAVDFSVTVADARDILFNGKHIVVMSAAPTNAMTLLNPDDGSVALQRTSPTSGVDLLWNITSVALGAAGTPRIWWDGESIWLFSNGTGDTARLDPDTLYPISYVRAVGSTANGFCAVGPGISLSTSSTSILSNTADLNGNAAFHSIWRLDTPLQPTQGGTGLNAVGANDTYLKSNGTTLSWATITTPTPEINTGDNGQRHISAPGQRRATAQRRYVSFNLSTTTAVAAMTWTGDDILTCEAGFVRSYNAASGTALGTYDALTNISITPTYIAFGGAATRSGAGVPCAWIGGTGGLAKLTYQSGAFSLQGSAVTTNMAVGGLVYDGQYVWILNTNQNCISRVDNANQSATGPTVTTNWTAASSLTTNGTITQRMVWDGRYLWSISTTDSKLYKIDTQATNTVSSFTLAGNPTAIAFDGRWLWIPIGSTMYRIDPSQSNPVASPTTYSMSGTPATGAVGLTGVTHIVPDGKWLWMMNSGLGSGVLPSVVKFDPETGFQISAHQGTNAPTCGIAIGHAESGGFFVIGTSSSLVYYADTPAMMVGALRMTGPMHDFVTRLASMPHTIGSSGTPPGGTYVCEASGAITLPTIGANNVAANGLIILVKNISGGNVTLQAATGESAEWGAAPATTTIATGSSKKVMWYRNGIGTVQWLEIT